MLKPTENASFWRDGDIVDLDCPFNFIVPKGSNPRGQWPGKTPSMTDILKELSLARVSYLRINKIENGKVFVNILSGRIIVHGHVVEKEYKKKIFLSKKNGIEYASNKQRSSLVSSGIRVKHSGIFCGEGFNDESKYTDKILNTKGIKILEIDNEDNEDYEEVVNLRAEECGLIDTLEQYIDSEYEIEQQTAQSTPPFSYFNLRPEVRKIVYRQFFRIDVDPDDLARMRELKVSLVTIETVPGDTLAAEIVDLNPSQEKSEIIISFEKQIPANSIPKSGLLRLDALPTLRNVRKSVTEQFRQNKTANPWLVSVAAGTYQYSPLKPDKIPLPPREYPPNPSQVDALDRGAGTDDYLLVLGPPGTGKTTVILDWVRYFVGIGKRVLITSQSNMAVDNVLERLAEESALRCVRLGNETKVSSGIRRILIDNFATNIQSDLVGRIAEVKEHLNSGFQSLQTLPDKIKQSHTFITKFRELEKQKSEISSTLSKSERDLNKIVAGHNKALDQWQKFEKLREKRECIFKKRSNARGILGLGKRLLSKLDGFRLSRIQNKISKIKEDIETIKKQRQIAQELVSKNRGQYDEVQNNIHHVEQSFKKFVEPHSALIPELSIVPRGGLKDFLEKQALKDIAQRSAQYKKLMQIIVDWESVFCGERQRSIYKVLLSMVDVVGATCIGINTNRDFKDIPFDVVIVDESGQIQLHNLIVPLSRGAKAILVGDHKQLPPVVQDAIKQELSFREVDDTFLSKSWFELLWQKAPDDRKAMMDTQFRCPSTISDFVSKAFYEGKYKAGVTTLPDKKKAIFSFFKQPMVFIDTSNYPEEIRRERSSRADNRPVVEGNPLETELVLQVLEQCLAEKPELGSKNEIGVIVPYANHVKEIQKAVRRVKRDRFKGLNTPINELVASVDSYQGQERDLVIMAFSRSNRAGGVGFLCDWRRLNVAMTRTKKQLVLIGDMSTLKKIDKKKGASAKDYEFKKAMAELEVFIKEKGHYIDAVEWKKGSNAKEHIATVDLQENAVEGVFAHV